MSEQNYSLTLTEVTHCIQLPAETIITIVDLGIVEPRGRVPDDWLFAPPMLGTLRRATRMQRDLELDWAAIALALSLLDKLQESRAENRCLRQQLRCLLSDQE
jgi:chaperone modulatory protein CbpM